MPKIEITEKDYTGENNSEIVNHMVFIPGFIGEFDESGARAEAAEAHSFVECLSVQEFEKRCGTHPQVFEESGLENFDKSWVMAHQLLRLGLPVLYYVIENKSELDTFDWNKLTDKSKFNIRFITTGAYPYATASKYEDMVEAAAKRGDCIALLDHPEELIDVVETSGTTSIPEYFKGVISGEGVTNEDKEALKYAAAFTPWCNFQEIRKLEGLGIEGKTLRKSDTMLLPATFAYLTSYAEAIKKNASWFAAAGSFRGVVPFAFSPKVVFGDAENELLQDRTKSGLISVNPICYIRPFGFLVWGNRTMLPVSSEEEVIGGLKASNFLNVRQLACDLKKAIYLASKKYTFEQNDDILWVNYQAEIKPTLDGALSGRGIKGYRIIKVNTNQKALLKAKVRVIPIEGVEDFKIDFELADSLEIVEE